MDVGYFCSGGPRFTSFKSALGNESMVDSFMTTPLNPNRAIFPENSNPSDEHEPTIKN